MPSARCCKPSTRQDFLECLARLPADVVPRRDSALDRVVHRGEGELGLGGGHRPFFDSLDRTRAEEADPDSGGRTGRYCDSSASVCTWGCSTARTIRAGAGHHSRGRGFRRCWGISILHYVLDLWFEREVKPRLLGKATLIQVAERILLNYVRDQDDGEARDGSTRQADGTLRTDPQSGTRPPIALRRPPSWGSRAGKVRPPSTFLVQRCTSREPKTGVGGCGARPVVRAACDGQSKSIDRWCRGNRHKPVKVHTKRSADGIPGALTILRRQRATFVDLLLVQPGSKRALFSGSASESKNASGSGRGNLELLKRFPLPRPSIRVRIWGA